MLFRQIIHEDLGCASYLVGDRDAGIAAVIDPQWDIDPYRRLARLHGVRIGHVLEEPTTMPTTFQATGAWHEPPSPRSTSMSLPAPTTLTTPSPTAGCWSLPS